MDVLANRLAAKMQKIGDLTDEQTDVVGYALHYIMSTLVGSAGILAVIWGLGIFHAGLLCTAAAVTLRLMSGGAHYSSTNLCAVLSIATFPTIALLAVQLPEAAAVPFSIFASVFSLGAVAIYAPVDSENKPLRESQRPFFRAASVVTVLAWSTGLFLLDVPGIRLAVSAGLLWQALSLTPVGHAWYRRVDRLFARRKEVPV